MKYLKVTIEVDDVTKEIGTEFLDKGEDFQKVNKRKLSNVLTLVDRRIKEMVHDSRPGNK